MGLVAFKERRMNDRVALTGLMPGKLCVVGTKTTISCRPVDVSEHGLGIVSSTEFEVGTQLVLKIGKTEIALQVVWGQPDFGKHDLQRYGLMTDAKSKINLLELFRRANCLRD